MKKEVWEMVTEFLTILVIWAEALNCYHLAMINLLDKTKIIMLYYLCSLIYVRGLKLLSKFW